jgi:hypothetical protein
MNAFFPFSFDLSPHQGPLNFDCASAYRAFSDKLRVREKTVFYAIMASERSLYPVVIFFGAKLVIFIAPIDYIPILCRAFMSVDVEIQQSRTHFIIMRK